MENYKKGKNVEHPFEKSSIPIKCLPDDFLWMHVKPGTKMRNVLQLAFEELEERRRAIVWSGSGPAVSKAISCAEIVKRRHHLYQVNSICYHKVKEYWEPEVDDLDPLVVVREQPTIHILLTKDPVDNTLLGYQAPLSERYQHSKGRVHLKRNKQHKNWIEADRFESFGLRSNRTKGPKRKQVMPTEGYQQTAQQSQCQRVKVKNHFDNSAQASSVG